MTAIDASVAKAMERATRCPAFRTEVNDDQVCPRCNLPMPMHRSRVEALWGPASWGPALLDEPPDPTYGPPPPPNAIFDGDFNDPAAWAQERARHNGGLVADPPESPFWRPHRPRTGRSTGTVPGWTWRTWVAFAAIVVGVIVLGWFFGRAV